MESLHDLDDFDRTKLIELVFLVGILGVLVVFYLDTIRLDTEARIIPRLLILISSVAILAQMILDVDAIKDFGILERIANSEVFEGDPKGAYVDETEDMYSMVKEETQVALRPKQMVYISAWLGVYTLSLWFVGFFTTNFLFMFLYVYTNDTETPSHKRGVSALFWAVGICVFLYVLYAEVLLVSSIFRLGITF